jgi:hypothetical protein
MALSMEQVVARVEALRYRNHERDARNLDVLAVRKGKIAQVYPNFFPEGVDANVVANFIDVGSTRPFRGHGSTPSNQLLCC